MNKKSVMDLNICLRGKYVLLTGDYKKAILLEYLIMRQEEDGKWFNASFNRISKESYLDLSIPTLKKFVNALINNNWIVYRNDPNLGFGSSNQYKVNFEKIEDDVKKLLENK